MMNNRAYEYDKKFRPISNTLTIIYKGILNGIDIAIKRAKNDEAFEGLKRESQILSSLDSTRIPKFIGLNEEEKEIYIEFVNGQVLNTFQNNTYDNKIKILTGIAQTLKYLHSNNVVHNDVKPANLILIDTINSKLIDYDVSYFTDNIYERFSKQIIYSQGYSAPEKLDLFNTGKSDIFSFGVIAYEMFVKRSPFDAEEENKAKFQKQVKSGPRIPLLLKDKTIEGMVESCLKLYPEDRPEASAVYQNLVACNMDHY